MAPGRTKLAVVAVAALAGLVAAACADVLDIQSRGLDPLAGGDGGGGVDSGPGCADPCPLALGLNHPFSITADDSNVYWTEYGGSDDHNGSVKSCPVTGCGAGPTVYAQLQASPRGLAIDAQNVYWGTTNTSAGNASNGAIWSCPLAGCSGPPTKVAPADAPFGIAVDATYVYWADSNDETVSRAPKAGGAAKLLWDGGTGVGGTNAAQEIAIDTSNVYVNDLNASAFRVPIGGGDLVPMYTDMNATPIGVFGLAVDSQDVYIGDLGGIFHMSKAATSGATALVPNVTDVVDLKVDPAGGVLYWADFGSGASDGTVGKVPLDGGTPVVLHQTLATPEAVTVNGTYVFWLSNGTLAADGNVMDGTGVLYRSAK